MLSKYQVIDTDPVYSTYFIASLGSTVGHISNIVDPEGSSLFMGAKLTNNIPPGSIVLVDNDTIIGAYGTTDARNYFGIVNREVSAEDKWLTETLGIPVIKDGYLDIYAGDWVVTNESGMSMGIGRVFGWIKATDDCFLEFDLLGSSAKWVCNTYEIFSGIGTEGVYTRNKGNPYKYKHFSGTNSANQKSWYIEILDSYLGGLLRAVGDSVYSPDKEDRYSTIYYIGDDCVIISADNICIAGCDLINLVDTKEIYNFDFNTSTGRHEILDNHIPLAEARLNKSLSFDYPTDRSKAFYFTDPITTKTDATKIFGLWMSYEDIKTYARYEFILKVAGYYANEARLGFYPYYDSSGSGLIPTSQLKLRLNKSTYSLGCDFPPSNSYGGFLWDYDASGSATTPTIYFHATTAGITFRDPTNWFLSPNIEGGLWYGIYLSSLFTDPDYTGDNGLNLSITDKLYSWSYNKTDSTVGITHTFATGPDYNLRELLSSIYAYDDEGSTLVTAATVGSRSITVTAARIICT